LERLVNGLCDFVGWRLKEAATVRQGRLVLSADNLTVGAASQVRLQIIVEIVGNGGLIRK